MLHLFIINQQRKEVMRLKTKPRPLGGLAEGAVVDSSVLDRRRPADK
jgi:hypothetical protein